MRALKIIVFVLFSGFASASLAWSGESEIRASIAQLATAKGFPEIEKIVKDLAALGDPLVNPALIALADGNPKSANLTMRFSLQGMAVLVLS